MRHLIGENISLQDRAKFYSLENILHDACELLSNRTFTGRALVEIESNLSEELTRLFNLNILISLSANDCMACVTCTPVNARHIFTEFEHKSTLDTIEYAVNPAQLDQALNAGKEGHVDLKNATVSGAFAESPSHVYLHVEYLFKLGVNTGPLLTAILLHEIGHVFTYYIYCSNTASINQILQRALKESVHSGAFMDKLTFKLMHGTTLDKVQLKELTDNKNKIVFSWKLSKVMYEHHASHSNGSIYDNTAAESMADNFAARCGYGAELVQTLVIFDKLGKGGIFENVNTASVASSTFEIVRRITEHTMHEGMLTRGIGPVVSFFIFLAMMIGIVLLHVLVVAGIKDDEETKMLRPAGLLRYDTTLYRIQRVRNLVISKLKKLRNPEKLKLVLQELDMIDSYMPPKETWAKHSTILGWIGKFLTAREKDQITLEQEMEKVISNDLLVAAATATLKF